MISRHLLVAAMLAVPGIAQAGMLDIISGRGISSYDAKANSPWIAQIDRKNNFPKPFVPNDKEMAPYARASIGREVAWAVSHGTYLVNAPQAQAICQSLVDAMLTTWKGPKPTIRIIIRGDATYGAEANETGDIFVNIGTFNADPSKGVQSEDELALMLGHELAHLLLPHIKNKQSMLDVVDGLTTAATLYMNYSMVANTHMSGNQLTIQADNNMLMQAAVGGLAATALVGDVLAPSWGSEEEGEADMLGLDLARRAGFLVGEDEARQFVEKHADSQAQHAARIEKLKTLGQSLMLAAKISINTGDGNADTLLGSELKSGGAALFGKMAEGVESLTADHPDRAKREKDLVDYVSAVYADGDTDASGKLLRKHAREVAAVTEVPSVRATVESADTAQAVTDLLVGQVATKLPQTGTQPVNNSSPVDLPKAQMPSQLAAAGKSPVTKPVAASIPGDLPSPCAPVAAAKTAAPVSVKRGRKFAPVSAPVPSPVSHGIDPDFPVDSAPFTWGVRGDWQSGSIACRALAPNDWLHSAQTDYASTETLHHIAIALSGTPRANMLPPIHDRYTALLGTDMDIPDLAEASALARGDTAMAETKAAECYGYQHHSLYAACVQILGYNPLDKASGGARTPVGQKAFSKAATDGTFSSFSDSTRSWLSGN